MSTTPKHLKELTDAFKSMFPNWDMHVREYRSFQRDVLIIMMDDGSSKVFLYKNQNDWTFGTKLYRAEPGKKNLKNKENSK